MTYRHPAELPTDTLLAQCDTRRLRRSGPGGQHRNKVETAVAIKHRESGIEAEASERRSQHANREVAIFRLRVQLALQVRRPIEPAAVPSSRWQARLKGGRIVVNPQHDDFPALLAEALDVLASHNMDVHAASEQLGVTISQMVKFLKLEPAALAQLNAHRQAAGQHPLR